MDLESTSSFVFDLLLDNDGEVVTATEIASKISPYPSVVELESLLTYMTNHYKDISRVYKFTFDGRAITSLILLDETEDVWAAKFYKNIATFGCNENNAVMNTKHFYDFCRRHDQHLQNTHYLDPYDGSRLKMSIWYDDVDTVFDRLDPSSLFVTELEDLVNYSRLYGQPFMTKMLRSHLNVAKKNYNKLHVAEVNFDNQTAELERSMECLIARTTINNFVVGVATFLVSGFSYWVGTQVGAC